MRYRKLGSTGLTVSEIGFGTIPILSGNVPVLPDYYSPELDEAVDIMMRAYKMGCNLYDTAIPEEYGDSEYKLGVFAEKVGRDNIIISDKARFMDGNDMFREVMRSTETLGTQPDIYFIHQVDEKNQDEAFSRYGALDALCDLKKTGIIRFTGIATHYYSVAERAASDSRVDVIQTSGNILERGIIDRISANSIFQNKGLILNKVYAAGCLLNVFSPAELIGGIMHWPFSCALIGIGTAGIATHYYSVAERAASDSRVDVIQTSGNILERGIIDRISANSIFQNKGLILNKVYAAGCLLNVFSPAELIGGIMHWPFSCALIGIGTAEQADAAMHEDHPPIAFSFDEVIDRLSEKYSPVQCTRCQKCICPNGYEIHILLRQYNYFHLGKSYWAMKKLKLNIDEVYESCRKCTDMHCMKDCLQKLMIPELIEMIHNMTL